MNLEFGKNLKSLRRRKDMTQDELAQALTLSVQAISRYETGAAYPDIEMLPVIAGFFGTTIDELLGVSIVEKNKRIDEYNTRLRSLTDRKERLELLRREKAEFPESWGVISDMIHEMTYIPECIDEMREIVNDAAKRCNKPLWRENIILFYLESEPDDKKAYEFIDKWCSKYDIRKPALLKKRFLCRNDSEKLRRISQLMLRNSLTESLISLTENNGNNAEAGLSECMKVLNFIDGISGSGDREKPDMWVETKLLLLLRAANSCFILSRFDNGFSILNIAITLFENLFALPEGTVLTYGSMCLDCLNAKTNKEIFYRTTEFTGIVAESVIINLYYENIIFFINDNEECIRDMEGFERNMVFSSHTYSILQDALWDGFALVKDDERYITLTERAKVVSSIFNPDNLIFCLRQQASRTDNFIRECKWISALVVPEVGAYLIFGPDNVNEKAAQMRREGHTAVSQIVTIQVGGDIIQTPESVLNAVRMLNVSNVDLV